MKKLNKVAIMFAVAAWPSAFASGSTINSDNWRNGHGNLIWKNSTSPQRTVLADHLLDAATPGCA